MAKSPPSLSFSLPCASFTHTTPGVSRRLNPSVRIDHWRAAAQSRGATLGASLLGGIIQKIIFSLLSLLRSPKSRNVSEIGAKRGKDSEFNLSNPLKNYPPSFEHLQPSFPTIPILLLQRSQAPQLRPYLRGISTPCMGHFILSSAAVEKVKAVDNITPFHQKTSR